MNFAHLSHRLSDYRIDRSLADAGTLFQGDTVFRNEAVVENFNPHSTCLVTKAQQTFSSHGGTHADKPAHFIDSPEPQEFDASQYSGSALLLQVSRYIQDDLIVTLIAVQAELEHLGIQHDDVRRYRILLRMNPDDTYSSDTKVPFAYLEKDAVAFLAERGCPMVAVDTKSIDAEHETCLAGANHGLCYTHGTAIVENVDLSAYDVSSRGEIATFFDSTRNYTDARGIAAMIFVPDDAHE